LFRPKLSWSLRSPLLWLAVLYILVGIAYARITPMLEKADEEGHYGYIVYLREHRALPPLEPKAGMLLFESKQPPLYYVVAAALTSWLPDIPDAERILVKNPYMDYSVPVYRNDNRNVYLHPPDMTPLFLGARLVSLAFGLGTMLVSYGLAAQLFSKDSLVPIATAAAVGFQPGFIFMATALNNDVAIAFFGAVVVAILVYRLQRGDWPCFPVLLGVALGLASITKVSALMFFPLVILALLLIHRSLRLAFFRDAFTIGAIALLVGGWWYARNALLYGDPFTLRSHLQELGSAAARPLWELLKRDLRSIEYTFWANPARTFVSPIWLDQVFVWWGRISLVLVVSGFLLNYRSLRANLPAWIVLSSWVSVFMLLLIGYWARQSSWAFGRFLLPAVAPIMLLLISGWQLACPPRWRRPVTGFGAGTVVVASLLIPFVSLYPLYHPSREWRASQVQYPVGTIYVDSTTGKQVARLVGYNLPKPFATTGDYFPIEFCWEPLGQTDVPYAMFVHLLDVSQPGNPAIWGVRETYPGLGSRPTDRWALKKIFCDRVMLQVSPEAPVPLGAAIEVGFVDPKSQDRLQAVTAEGDRIDLAVVGRAPVISSRELAQAKQTARYVLGNAIGLDQAQVTTESKNSITLTLTWQSLQPVSYDATLFIHLIGTDGKVVAQTDRQPLNGRFPTSCWLPGQAITDTVTLSIPPDVNDGPLVLRLGMYTWPSLQRLSVVNARGEPELDGAISIDVTLW
jgi:4-amino-4-deoxy-L-arabinose transferase-like glycosyltransferase